MDTVRSFARLALGLFLGLLIILAAALGTAFASEDAGRRDNACPAAERQSARQLMHVLYEEDQGKREPENGRGNDERRETVARIFAKGCLISGETYFEAALIFQHGTVPEHYHQALYWAEKAKALSYDRADWLIPRAADRYLMSMGRKQLFGTNLISNKWFHPEEPLKYWCLWPTEESFPDEKRAEYAGRIETMDAQIAKVRDMNHGELPADGAVCRVNTEPSPKGILPGLW